MMSKRVRDAVGAYQAMRLAETRLEKAETRMHAAVDRLSMTDLEVYAAETTAWDARRDAAEERRARRRS